MARTFTLASCLYLGLILPYISTKVYRTDYEFNEQLNAFYKFHIETSRWITARSTCQLEGADLLVPSHQDIVHVHRMFKRFPDVGDYVWVNDDGQTHESAEEPAVINFEQEETSTAYPWDRHCDVVTRSGEVQTVKCLQYLPFICKVEAKNAYHDRDCNVYGRDYVLAPTVHSCYKIPTVPFTWNQAYAECSAEGAHLVILNSQAEHDYVKELMNSRRGSVQGSKATWFFFAGFRAQPTTDGSPRVFKTIFNETLEEAGYSMWTDNEPNNASNNENCGTLFKNDGKFNDVDCSHFFGFICEKEVPTA